MGSVLVRQCYTLFRGPVRRVAKDRVISDPLVDIELPVKMKSPRALTMS
jgi:hypothetical protein